MRVTTRDLVNLALILSICASGFVFLRGRLATAKLWLEWENGPHGICCVIHGEGVQDGKLSFDSTIGPLRVARAVLDGTGDILATFGTRAPARVEMNWPVNADAVRLEFRVARGDSKRPWRAAGDLDAGILYVPPEALRIALRSDGSAACVTPEAVGPEGAALGIGAWSVDRRLPDARLVIDPRIDDACIESTVTAIREVILRCNELGMGEQARSVDNFVITKTHRAAAELLDRRAATGNYQYVEVAAEPLRGSISDGLARMIVDRWSKSLNKDEVDMVRSLEKVVALHLSGCDRVGPFDLVDYMSSTAAGIGYPWRWGDQLPEENLARYCCIHVRAPLEWKRWESFLIARGHDEPALTLMKALGERAPSVSLRDLMDDLYGLDSELAWSELRRAREPSELFKTASDVEEKDGGHFRDELPGPLAIALSCRNDGLLDNCGCVRTKRGGLCRKVQLIKSAKQRFRDILFLDLGDLVANPFLMGQRTANESVAVAASLVDAGCDVFVPGTAELLLPRDHVKALKAVDGYRWTCANVFPRSIGTGVPAPYRDVVVDGVSVRVFGLYEPDRHLIFPDIFERGVCSEYEIRDPYDALQQFLPAIAAAPGYVAVAGSLSAETIRRIRDDLPGRTVDLLFTSLERSPLELLEEVDGEVILRVSEPTCLHSESLCVIARRRRYGLSWVYIDPYHPGQYSVWHDSPTSESAQDDGCYSKITDLMQSRLEGLIRTGGPLSDLEAESQGSSAYVGSQACAGCHSEIFDLWSHSPHGHALQSLASVGADKRADCVGCHVVGIGSPSGFAGSEVTTSQVDLGAVGCETCHGPGSEHVRSGYRSPQSLAIRSGLNQVECMLCHDPENSPDFIGSGMHLFNPHSSAPQENR